MTPNELGKQAAARENEADLINPFAKGSQEHIEWHCAVDLVLARRAKQQDPGGHLPPPPHLCASNPSKVCNCCERCATPCFNETKRSKQADPAWIMPRIALALERLVDSNTPHDWQICSRCGCTLVPMSGICPVCGEKT